MLRDLVAQELETSKATRVAAQTSSCPASCGGCPEVLHFQWLPVRLRAQCKPGSPSSSKPDGVRQRTSQWNTFRRGPLCMKAAKLAGALSPAVTSAGRREGQADVDRGDCRRRTQGSAAREHGLAVAFQPQGYTCSNSAAARATTCYIRILSVKSLGQCRRSAQPPHMQRSFVKQHR